MNLHTKYITQNPYYKAGKYISGSDLYGFMLHSVGVGQPDPMVFIRGWDNPNYTKAGINGFIGEDDVYITAPCLETKGKVMRMPHGGKACSNDHYIGFEMCEPGTIVYTGKGAEFVIKNKAAAQAFVKKTYANAVALFAELCTFHGKDPLASGVIVSHNEMGKKGLATGHVDPEHLWKGLDLPYTMDGFRKDVKAAMGGGSSTTTTTTSQLYRVRKTWKDAKTQIGAFANLNSAKAMADSNPGYKVYDKSGKVVYNPAETDKAFESYIVKVTANVLNVRSGAGTNYKINRTVKAGEAYTIVEEQNGWGKLKSGAGWISLEYTKRV